VSSGFPSAELQLGMLVSSDVDFSAAHPLRLSAKVGEVGSPVAFVAAASGRRLAPLTLLLSLPMSFRNSRSLRIALRNLLFAS